MAFFPAPLQILPSDRRKTAMLNAEPRELENIYRNAIESAALLRRSGETAKAVRVESLARIVSRQLERHGSGCGAGVPPVSDSRETRGGRNARL